MRNPLSALLAMLAPLPASAQQTSIRHPPRSVSPPPDKLETSIGPLQLSDRYPDAATVEKIYDNLDRSRVLQAMALLSSQRLRRAWVCETSSDA